MSSLKMESIEVHLLESIQNDAVTLLESKFTEGLSSLQHLSTVGYLCRGVPAIELEAIRLGTNRLQTPVTEFDWDHGAVLSTEELSLNFEMVSKAVDFLLTAYVDMDTFSAGRNLTSMLAKSSLVPTYSIRDDVYAHLSGQAALLGIKQRTRELQGKKIAIMWTFGTQFVLPNFVQSVLLQGSCLGARMRVVTPEKFPVLRRVVKECESIGDIEITNQFTNAFDDIDAVIPVNWCRIDDFSHPERYGEVASEFRDWHLEKETIPENCVMITEPPIQLDVSVSSDLVTSERNLTRNWYNLVAASLLSSMSYVHHLSQEQKQPVFLH